MNVNVGAKRIETVRQFNRFYTQRIGVVTKYLGSEFSLAEVRVLYELAQRQHLTATEIGRDLGLDAGYLSRIVRGFEDRKLVSKEPSPEDARQSILRLTEKGRGEFAKLNQLAQQDIARLMEPLTAAEQIKLVESMTTIQSLLASKQQDPIIFRPHQPGDMGWIVHRHGVLYSQEYGWNEEFEALVAEIVAAFIRKFDSKRERCWIAERNGAILGSVFLVHKSDADAQLRLLFVEPGARGLGIGRRLVDECIRFAKQSGYERILLWTNDVLHAARHIYENSGFVLVQEDRHHSFGKDLVGQTWQLNLNE